ncbi:unnamed protein product [Linum tenue]|uniref:Uncharacterized protein n=1 Tax=Linum tenue TaxID=586396 RepID=A0AAV0J570_9ROSI|nr:unnamed protein product [Linum tenue]
MSPLHSLMRMTAIPNKGSRWQLAELLLLKSYAVGTNDVGCRIRIATVGICYCRSWCCWLAELLLPGFSVVGVAATTQPNCCSPPNCTYLLPLKVASWILQLITCFGILHSNNKWIF